MIAIVIPLSNKYPLLPPSRFSVGWPKKEILKKIITKFGEAFLRTHINRSRKRISEKGRQNYIEKKMSEEEEEKKKEYDTFFFHNRKCVFLFFFSVLVDSPLKISDERIS